MSTLCHRLNFSSVNGSIVTGFFIITRKFIAYISPERTSPRHYNLNNVLEKIFPFYVVVYNKKKSEKEKKSFFLEVI